MPLAVPSNWAQQDQQAQPNSMNSVGSIMNLAKGAQGLQFGQQAIQSNNMDLQKQNQANNERVALQGYISDPDNWQTDGQIDMAKMNKAVPAIAPMTGSDVLQKFSVLSGAQTQAIQAKQNLTQSQRAIVAGPIGVLGRAGVQDPNVYAQELDNVVAQNPDNPTLGKLVDAYKTTLSMTPPGQHVADTAIRASQSLLGPTEQQATLSPKAEMVNTGNSIQPVINQPAVGGNPPSVTAGGGAEIPLQLPPTQQTIGPNGQPGVIGPKPIPEMPNQPDNAGGLDVSKLSPLEMQFLAKKDPLAFANGVRAMQQNSQQSPSAQSPATLPQSGFVPTGLAPSDAAAIPALAAERQQVNNAASTVGDQHFNNAQIIRLATKQDGDILNPTGPYASTIAHIGAIVGSPVSSDYATRLAQINHYIGLQTQKNELAMGVNTDAGRATAAPVVGSTDVISKALISNTKVNDASASGLSAFNNGMETAIQGAGGNVLAKRSFQNAWSNNYDPNVFRADNAIKNGDTAELSAIKSEVGSNGLKQLAQKRINLMSLEKTGALPNAQ